MFCNCINLQSVILPNNLIGIYNGVFKNCYKLKSLIIPDNTKYLGCYCFDNCYNLTQIKIPNSIKIDTNCFNNCQKIKVNSY